MKYSSSTAVVQSWTALHANVLKLHSITGIFQRISPQVQNSDIEKCILMAAPEGEFILETFLHGCFSKAAANIYILEIVYILHIFYISYFDVTLKRNEFLWIFLSKGFGEKCKPTELALNFIQK